SKRDWSSDVCSSDLAVLGSGEADVVHQLLLGDLRLLDVSQCVQEQLGADGALSGLAGIFLELLAGDVLGCEHLLEDLLVATELADELLDLALHLLVNQD